MGEQDTLPTPYSRAAWDCHYLVHSMSWTLKIHELPIIETIDESPPHRLEGHVLAQQQDARRECSWLLPWRFKESSARLGNISHSISVLQDSYPDFLLHRFCFFVFDIPDLHSQKASFVCPPCLKRAHLTRGWDSSLQGRVVCRKLVHQSFKRPRWMSFRCGS